MIDLQSFIIIMVGAVGLLAILGAALLGKKAIAAARKEEGNSIRFGNEYGRF